MKGIKILSVRARSSQELSHLDAEYCRRIRRHLPLEMVDVKRQALRNGVPSGPALEREAKDILAHVSRGDVLAALSERGKLVSTPELAVFLTRQQLSCRGWLAVVIGGPMGLAEQVERQAHALFGLSRLTLPHLLVRTIWLEALYRALDVNHGGPYHKGDAR